MKKFAALIQTLEQYNAHEVQKAALIEYFSIASDKDKLWSVALFLRKRPKRVVPIQTLKAWTIEHEQFPIWLFEETYSVVGDLSETIAKILPPAQRLIDKNLSEWMLELDHLSKIDVGSLKDEIVKILTHNERFIIVKLLSGGFRYELSQKTLGEALAIHLRRDPADITYRMMSKWQPLNRSFKALFLKNDVSSEYSKPYPFYLAEELISEAESLGNPDDWLAEHLWDGVRGQIIKRNDGIYLWTRADELISDQCPEFNQLVASPRNFVLDGVLMIEREGNIQGSEAVKKRLSRKTLTKKLLNELPLIFVAFDLMELDGKDLTATNQEERRVQLNLLNSELASFKVVLFSENLLFNSWSKLSELKTQASGFKSNGLIIKAKKGNYKSGRVGSDWLKWRADPMKAILVLIYAEKAARTRTNLFVNFTFAAKEGDSYIPVAKSNVGLSVDEIQEISLFIKENTIEKFGPVRQIKPELVFEITFQGLSLSSRRKAGIALRSPQIKCWRQDISVAKITELSEIKKFL